MTHSFPFSILSLRPGRIFLSSCSVAFIAGWFFSTALIWTQYETSDAEAGLSLRDVRWHFSGNPFQNRFETMVEGEMLEYLTIEEDANLLRQWSIQPNLPDFSEPNHKQFYQDNIHPIIELDCLECHEPGGKAEESPLRSYDEVLPYLERDRGIPIPSLLKLSHIHLFGMSLLLLVTGALAFSFLSPRKAGILSSLTGLGLLLDVGGWWSTKFFPETAFLVLVGGSLFGGSFLLTHLSLLHRYWRSPSSSHDH